MKSKFEKRPWGGFRTFVLNKKVSVKILSVKSKKRLSLQKHRGRAELWRFLDNPAKITLGKRVIMAKKGDEVFVKKGEVHRIEALGKDVNVLEVSFGSFLERDIIRLEDDFGRLRRK